MKRLVFFRRMSQVFFLAVFIYILWSTTYPLQGALPAEIFFKADPLVMIITAVSERIVLPGIVFSLLLLLLTFVFGRFFCGWICPLGTTIDIVGSRPRRRLQKEAGGRRGRYVKFFILAIVSLAAIAGIQVAWLLDPIVIMARFVSLNLIPAVTLAVHRIFIFLMQTFHMRDALMDIYQALKNSFFGVKLYYFPHTWSVLFGFLIIVLFALWKKRLWCRFLCPLGAVYALMARFSRLRLTMDQCSRCGSCVRSCRMNAINENATYYSSECVLCMDCLYDCPRRYPAFRFRAKNPPPQTASVVSKETHSGMTRRNFLVLAGMSLLALGFRKYDRMNQAKYPECGPIRPPGALPEKEFSDRCIRCGNCMKVCITNGLQPVLFGAGLEGMWTPQLVPEIGYCEYNCTLCGNVCPTGAIRRLSVEEKHRKKLGLARIDRKLCLPWARDQACIVCEEHCPVPDKAIKLEKIMRNGFVLSRPVIDERMCVGCGICQSKCPVRPLRAVRVAV